LKKGEIIKDSYPVEINYDPMNNCYICNAIDFKTDIDGDTVEDGIKLIRNIIKDKIKKYKNENKEVPKPSNIIDNNIHYVTVLHA